MFLPLRRPPLLLALALLALGAATVARSQTQPAPAAPPRELVIVIVDSLERGPGRGPNFDRLKRVFTQVFSARKWPVTIRVEHFTGNLPPPDLELQIFNQGIHPQDRGDQTFHAWITLTNHGKVSDFGMVRYQYYPRPLEPAEEVLEQVVRGAAEETADKVGALLFPAPRHS